MNKLFNKVLAVAMAGTMVVGASVTAFAADVDGATGAGESTGHLDTNIVSAVLPTSSVDGVFAFTIDPEDILAKAGKIKGSTAVTANDERVYFTKTAGGFGSTSDDVEIGAQNYVAADLSVTAEIGDPASGKTIIPLAESAEELAAATEPTLLLTLNVGTKSGVITADGVKVEDTIAEQSSNFDVDWETDKYVLKPKADATWSKLAINMSGEMSAVGEVSEDVVAPTVTLTWDVKAHADKPTVSANSIVAGGSVDVTLPDGITITEIQKLKGDGTYNTLPTDLYTLTDITGGKKLTIKAAIKTQFAAATSIKIVFSSGDPIVVGIE